MKNDKKQREKIKLKSNVNFNDKVLNLKISDYIEQNPYTSIYVLIKLFPEVSPKYLRELIPKKKKNVLFEKIKSTISIIMDYIIVPLIAAIMWWIIPPDDLFNSNKSEKK